MKHDDENRLMLVSDDSAHTFRTGFTYDGLGRLRARESQRRPGGWRL